VTVALALPGLSSMQALAAPQDNDDLDTARLVADVDCDPVYPRRRAGHRASPGPVDNGTDGGRTDPSNNT